MDYPAEVDIHTTKEGKKYGVFCEKTDVNNNKEYPKKIFGYKIMYCFEEHRGYLFEGGNKVSGKEMGIPFKPSEHFNGWNKERFEKKLSTLSGGQAKSKKAVFSVYTRVFFIYTMNKEGYVSAVDFIETEGMKQEKNNPNVKIEVVETDKLRNSLMELYQDEFDEFKIKH